LSLKENVTSLAKIVTYILFNDKNNNKKYNISFGGKFSNI
jgi:hypothetical protein